MPNHKQPPGWRILRTGERVKVIDAKKDFHLMLTIDATKFVRATATECVLANQMQITKNRYCEIHRSVAFVKQKAGEVLRYTLTPRAREIVRCNDLYGSKALLPFVGTSVKFNRPRGGTRLAFLRSKIRKLRDAGRLGRGKKPTRAYNNTDHAVINLRPKAI